MFTGIVETLGKVTEVTENGTNKTFWIESDISDNLQIDQSVSHSGVCLTVEKTEAGQHQVTAILETLEKTNLGALVPGELVNLERCLPMNGRLDGHLVQGHVDATALCKDVKTQDGSWEYRFRFPDAFASLIIEKGSICLNGISLTVFDVSINEFSVAVIPYTHEHTNIQQVQTGQLVNIEFDMVGKYIVRNLELNR